MSRLSPNIEPLEPYKTALSYIKCRCKTCEYEWLIKPNDLLNGHGCPKCAGVLRKTHNDFLEEMKRIHPAIKVLGDYVNRKTHIKCQCLIDGYVWEPTPNDLINGHGCPMCNGGIPDTKDSFLDKLIRINKDVFVVGEYINSQTEIECKCKVCGYTWKPKPNMLMNGHGCPCCKRSHGERRISSYLDTHNINYIPQYSFDDCRDIHKLFFDFWLPDHITAIEYQGEQHYRQSWFDYVNHGNIEAAKRSYDNARKRDEIKRQYCRNNNIKLIEIPYTELKHIEQVLDNYLL